MLRAARRDFEPHGEPELALRQLALQRLAQVLDFFLVDPQIRVARDAELRVVHHVTAGEELVQMRVHDRRKQHEGVVGSGHLPRHVDHTRHQPGRLDDRHGGLAPESVSPRELDDEVQALVDHLRKRVCRVEADRGEQRPDLVLKIFGDPGPLCRVAVGVVQHPYARRVERWEDMPVEHAVHLGDQSLCTFANLAQVGPELLQRHSDQRSLQAQLLAQARDPDLEELVEVAAHDAEEAQPLEQRSRRILGERKHPAVERQDRQLAIDCRWIGLPALGRIRGGHDRGHRRARGGH